MAIDDNYVYWSEYKANDLSKINRADISSFTSGTVVNILNIRTGFNSYLYYDSGHLYYTDKNGKNGNKGIYRWNTSTTTGV